jgi:hypothetical protein
LAILLTLVVWQVSFSFGDTGWQRHSDLRAVGDFHADFPADRIGSCCSAPA